MQNKQIRRPKIGLALSGASGRAVGHIGIIEVLRENNIPIDVIVACSSGALVAAGFAVGTLEYLKNLFFNLTKKQLLGLWSIKSTKGGLFNIHSPTAMKEWNSLTKGLSFEDLDVKVGFTASDINTGELVTINSGDLNQALWATVAVPGLFEPAIINGRILVDGGLVNIVPTIPTKQLGADIVIGVDLAATKFIYQRQMPIWRLIRFFRRVTGLHYVQHEIIGPLTSKILGKIDTKFGLNRNGIKVPNMFSMLFKAVDHSLDIEKEWTEEQISCDLMLAPKVKHFGKLGISNFHTIYEEGRKTALEALPKIRKLMQDFEDKQRQVVNIHGEKVGNDSRSK